MPLTQDQDKEYRVLWNRHSGVLLYPQMYDHKPEDDIFVSQDDRHEWHDGAVVRRLAELADLRRAAP